MQLNICQSQRNILDKQQSFACFSLCVRLFNDKVMITGHILKMILQIFLITADALWSEVHKVFFLFASKRDVNSSFSFIL